MQMLFADETTAWLVAAGTLATTLLGGLGTAVVLILRERAKLNKDDREDVWQKQAALIDRLDKQLAQVQVEQQRGLVAEMACRQEVARLRALGQWLYDLLHGFHAAMERAGHSPDPIPEFPDFASMPAATAAEREFTQRSMEHTTELVRREVSDSKVERPPGTNHDPAPR